MKRSSRIILSIVAGICVGGILIVLVVPFVARHSGAVLGGIATLSLLTLSVLVYASWHRRLNQMMEQDASVIPATIGHRWKGTPILAFGLLVLAGLISTLLLVFQNTALRTSVIHKKEVIAQQTARMDSTRYGSLAILMHNLFDKIDRELISNPDRVLSNETISRIAALSYSYKPYNYVIGDTLSKVRLSPERGQLLLALTKMHIDTSSLDNVMLQTTFEGADLAGADLRGAYLKRIDLRGANLRHANLEGTNLTRADLRSTNFWGASMNNAILTAANMKRADLRWAELNMSDLRNAELDGAKLASAKFRKAVLSGAFIRWADLSGAFFNQADLTEVRLTDSNVERAEFSHSNLSGASLLRLKLSEANFSDAELSQAIVLASNWPEQLAGHLVVGANEIQLKYQTVDYLSEFGPRYRLQKK